MTTIRQAHHKSYVCISNQLAQDPNISLKALGLMTYLLSLPDNWQVNLNQLISSHREGRLSILNALKELKNAGYIHHQKMGFKETWQYWVFEKPTSEEEFKEFLRTMRFPIRSQIAPIQNTNIYSVHTSPIEIQSTNKTSEVPEGTSLSKDANASPTLSSDALEMANYFWNKIKDRPPKKKPPNIPKWASSLQKLNARDQKSWAKIREVIDWAMEDSFWPRVILSPDNLRKHFERMEVQKEPLINAGSIVQRNKQYAIRIKDFLISRRRKEPLRLLEDRCYANNEEIMFSIKEQDFKKQMLSIYNLSEE